jgi:hypothetical protein
LPWWREERRGSRRGIAHFTFGEYENFTDIAFINLNACVVLPGTQIWRISYGKGVNLNNTRIGGTVIRSVLPRRGMIAAYSAPIVWESIAEPFQCSVRISESKASNLSSAYFSVQPGGEIEYILERRPICAYPATTGGQTYHHHRPQDREAEPFLVHTRVWVLTRERYELVRKLIVSFQDPHRSLRPGFVVLDRPNLQNAQL